MSVSISMSPYTHVCTYVYANVCTNIHIYIYTHVCTHIRVRVLAAEGLG